MPRDHLKDSNFALEFGLQVRYSSAQLPGREAADLHRAGVVELVDAPDSKSGSERSVGSIPTTRTIQLNLRKLCLVEGVP